MNDALRDLYKELYLAELDRREKITSSVAVPLTAMAFVAISLTIIGPRLVENPTWTTLQSVAMIATALSLLLLAVGIFNLTLVEGARRISGYPYPPKAEAFERWTEDEVLRRNELGISATPPDRDEIGEQVLLRTLTDGYARAFRLNERRVRFRRRAIMAILVSIVFLLTAIVAIYVERAMAAPCGDTGCEVRPPSPGSEPDRSIGNE